MKIMVEAKLRLPVRTLLKGDAKLEEFFLDRIRYYFKDIRGFKYDEVRAVLAAGWDNLPDVQRRLEALTQVRPKSAGQLDKCTENIFGIDVARIACFSAAQPPRGRLRCSRSSPSGYGASGCS